MDYLESLGKQISEITMYDVRSAYNNAKAMVLNLSEMEKMVTEATSNEAWGASSTLMQQIAQGTHNYQNFNEIMPAIYRRFTDLDARQWRQVYKALTLLEYLIKNGSERVVDDARQHLSLIKILRNFHYIDEKGKDQGINVRNRSKEVAELLQDLDKVRQERKKAKQNRNKYGGVSSEGSRYGGFGSDSFGNGGSSNYEPYGGGSASFRESSRSERDDDFDEYDAGDDEDRPARRTSPMPGRTTGVQKAMPPAPKKKEPEVNLFDLDDEEQAPAPAPVVAAAAASASMGDFDGDDDFDDFQGAVPAAAQAPKPSGFASGPLSPLSTTSTKTSGKASFFDMVSPGASSVSSITANNTNSRPMSGFASPIAPRYSPSGPPLSGPPLSGPPLSGPPLSVAPLGHTTMSPPRFGSGMNAQPAVSTPSIQPQVVGAGAAKSSGGGGFDDLWDLAGGSSAAAKSKPLVAPPAAGGGQSMASMAQQQLWNAPASSAQNYSQHSKQKSGASAFDLLM